MDYLTEAAQRHNGNVVFRTKMAISSSQDVDHYGGLAFKALPQSSFCGTMDEL